VRLFPSYIEKEKVMTRRKHSSGFKAQVALEAIRGDVTIAEIAKKHNIHPGQVQAWKAEALSKLESSFDKNSSRVSSSDEQVAVLERKIGQLTIENDFLKKSWSGYVKRNGGK
jgi:transposase